MVKRERLSVLTFSRNDIKSLLGLVREVYGIADEIVLIDSSDRRERGMLLKEKKRRRLSKLRIFYAIPLGLAELYRVYGLHQCKNRWILHLDADERLSDGLKRDVKRVIKNARHDAFAIKRYEYVVKGRLTSFFTWNIRLFKRDKILYRGLTHEQPIVRGRLGRLPDEDYLENRLEYHNFLTGYEYSKMLCLERLSYESYNRLVLEYLRKVGSLPGSESADDTTIGRVIRRLLRGYERLTLRRPGQELGNLDYFIFHATKYLIFFIKQRDVRGMLSVIPNALRYLDQIRECKEAKDGAEVFEISKMVSETGMIQLLGLDDDKRMRELNLRYKDKELKGADLLMHLLKEEYKKINKLNA